MPRLSELTDFDPMGSFTGAQPTAAPAEMPSPLSNNVDKILNSIFRPDEKRLQLWPERLVREGITAAGDVAAGKVPTLAIDPATGDVHTSPEMIEKAQAVSALAGTGGLASGGGSLNATPSLRPALKHNGKLYKGKPGQEHQDIIPDALYKDFQKKAMSGEDLAEYNFGFYNDKGHFLSREDALKYGIDNGLIDPQAGKYGALTSTLFSDSSKPGVAIEAYHGTNKNFNKFELGQNPQGSSGARESAIGHWFTNNPETASSFADWADRGLGGANVIPAKLNLKNPLIINSYDEIKNLVDKHTKFEKPGYEVAGRQIRMRGDKVDYDALRKELKDKGHDGIILKNTLTDSPDGKTPIDQYVVFEPNTVKSKITGQTLYSQPVPLPPGYELKPVEYNPFEQKT